MSLIELVVALSSVYIGVSQGICDNCYSVWRENHVQGMLSLSL